MSDKKSPIDDFFYSLYGYYPPKDGKAYELLVNAALKLIFEEKRVFFDQYVDGLYSKTKHQLDGIIDGITIEAKDKTKKSKPVGLSEIEKQEGGLLDLPYKGGILSSATGFTKPTKQYAEATTLNPGTKKIELYNIRQSSEEDEKGRIKTVILEFLIVYLDTNKGQFFPWLPDDGKKILSHLFPNGLTTAKVGAIYNENKTIFLSMKDWINELSSLVQYDEKNDVLKGIVNFDNKYLILENTLIKIERLYYIIPILRTFNKIEIKRNGNACLFVKNEDGTIDTLLTDIQMKSITFDDMTKEVTL
jgi:hypothetical protein